MHLPTLLSLVGFGLVVGYWAHYLSAIPRGLVPVWPAVGIALVALGMIASAAAIVIGAMSGGVGALAVSLSVIAWVMGGLFFFLLSQRKTPLGRITVTVGDPLPSFEAHDHAGALFNSDELRGRRVLIKFFRGQW